MSNDPTILWLAYAAPCCTMLSRRTGHRHQSRLGPFTPKVNYSAVVSWAWKIWKPKHKITTWPNPCRTRAYLCTLEKLLHSKTTSHLMVLCGQPVPTFQEAVGRSLESQSCRCSLQRWWRQQPGDHATWLFPHGSRLNFPRLEKPTIAHQCWLCSFAGHPKRPHLLQDSETSRRSGVSWSI